MAVCRQCKFWNYEYKKIMPDNKEYNIGECRIRLPGNSPYFREMFDYEWCGEFEPEVKIAEEKKKSVISDTAKEALNFLETTPRPPARATSATWDEFLDTIKIILRGEHEKETVQHETSETAL